MGVIGIVVANGSEGDEEECGGNCGNSDEPYVNRAMETLARAAVNAFGEVLLVVAAHLRRDAGDVVSPACQDIAYYLINTF